MVERDNVPQASFETKKLFQYYEPLLATVFILASIGGLYITLKGEQYKKRNARSLIQQVYTLSAGDDQSFDAKESTSLAKKLQLSKPLLKNESLEFYFHTLSGKISIDGVSPQGKRRRIEYISTSKLEQGIAKMSHKEKHIL